MTTQASSPKFQPKYPEGTPEYAARAAEMKTELGKFARGDAPYEYEKDPLMRHETVTVVMSATDATALGYNRAPSGPYVVVREVGGAVMLWCSNGEAQGLCVVGAAGRHDIEYGDTWSTVEFATADARAHLAAHAEADRS